MTGRKFGKLIGVLEVGNSYCKFLIYALKNSEILTCHELKINKIDGNDEDEYDPIELWNTVQEVRTNLLILKIYSLYLTFIFFFCIFATLFCSHSLGNSYSCWKSSYS
ncbi:hypothetical protein ACKWTF_012333 [Chironomus riparius]